MPSMTIRPDVGRLEPDEATGERRLSRPGFADDADALALADLDRNACQRRDRAASPYAAEELPELLHADERLGRPLR